MLARSHDNPTRSRIWWTNGEDGCGPSRSTKHVCPYKKHERCYRFFHTIFCVCQPKLEANMPIAAVTQTMMTRRISTLDVQNWWRSTTYHQTQSVKARRCQRKQSLLFLQPHYFFKRYMIGPELWFPKNFAISSQKQTEQGYGLPSPLHSRYDHSQRHLSR
jgi:hypothetical protein